MTLIISVCVKYKKLLSFLHSMNLSSRINILGSHLAPALTQPWVCGPTPLKQLPCLVGVSTFRPAAASDVASEDEEGAAGGVCVLWAHLLQRAAGEG